MPIYVWKCPSCGQTDERQQSSYDPAPLWCMACDSLMRLDPSAAAVVYRGAGWAKQDRRKDKS
jgi:putative FmdB family regulatory protein